MAVVEPTFEAEDDDARGNFVSRIKPDTFFKPLKLLAICSFGSLATAAFVAPNEVVMLRKNSHKNPRGS